MTENLRGIKFSEIRNKIYTVLLALAVPFLGCGVMANAPCAEFHTVNQGETFYGIANDKGLTDEEITNLNPDMTQLGTIYSGQQICVR